MSYIEQKDAVFHGVYAQIWAILMPLPKYNQKKGDALRRL